MSLATTLPQYTSCMKVGIGGDLGLSREYSKKLFGPLFYSWRKLSFMNYSIEMVVCNYNTFDNIAVIEIDFTELLKDSCW